MDKQSEIIFLEEQDMEASPNTVQAIQQDLEEIKKDIVHIKESNVKTNILLDKIFHTLENRQIMPQPDIEHESLLNEYCLPLTTHEQINNFNVRLEDQTLKNELINLLAALGGTNGSEDAGKLIYKLVDKVFVPQVLTEYTWTGISRSNRIMKSFNKFENIINVFYEVLLMADNRHTKEKTDFFFKNHILKHAKKRAFRKKVVSAGNFTDKIFVEEINEAAALVETEV